MENRALMFVLLAATFGCSGGGFTSGSEGLSGRGSSGAAGDPSGGDSGSAALAPTGGAEGASGGAGGAGEHNPSGGSGGLPGSGGQTPTAGGETATGGASAAGGEPGSGGGPEGFGGTPGQGGSPGGSGGSDLPPCTAPDAVTTLPPSVTLQDWSFTRSDTGKCATCVSDPCVTCTLQWTLPQWNGDTATWLAAPGVECVGTALQGTCGSETTCDLYSYMDASGSSTVRVDVEPCGRSYCPAEIHIDRFAPTEPTCLSEWGADTALKNSLREEFLDSLESTVWHCPAA